MRIAFRYGCELLHCIDLPFVRRLGRTVVLRTPWGSEVGLDRGDYTKLLEVLGAHGAHTINHMEFYRALCTAVANGGNGHIQVKPAGNGPTQRSRRVRFCARLNRSNDDKSITTHTVTVPVSMVAIVEGRHYLPRWFATRVIRERVLKNKSWPSLPDAGVWLDAQRAWSELFDEPVRRLEQYRLDAEGKAAQRLRRRVAEYAAERAAWESSAPERERKDRETALERKRSTDKSAARRAALETIKGVTIEWTHWSRSGGRLTKHVSTRSNVTLQYSGNRVYIVCEDGSEWISTTPNVRIVGALKG